MADPQRSHDPPGDLWPRPPGAPPRADEGAPGSDRGDALAASRAGIQIGGKFTLQRQIASGTYGTVFEAWDMFLARRVAIKLLHPHYARNQDAVRRFRREAQAAASIQHPNVVCILEIGKHRDGSFFIVQELLEGMTLRELLTTRRPSLHESIAIIVPVLGGLTAAHRAGVIHRDIKPENIILSPTGSGEIIPKIIDFGIAKRPMVDDGKITTNMVLGTVCYMAPEQARGDGGADARVDVWSAAMVLFELLTGVIYYDAPTQQRSLVRLMSEPAPRLDLFTQSVPAALSAVIHRALHLDPAKRYPSAQAFCDELLAAHQGGIVPLRSDDRLSNQSPPPALAPAMSPAVYGSPPLDPAAPEGSPDDNADLTPMPPPLQSDVDWADGRPPLALDTPEGLAEAAAQAVSDNALHDAVRYATRAIELAPEGSGIAARMLVMQAIAHRWLGNYLAAEEVAEKAMARLPRGSVGWHAALGHFIIASGYLGRAERLRGAADDLLTRSREVEDASSHFITCCRLAVFLVRLGSADRAHKVLLDAQRIAHKHGSRGPFIDAWSDVAHAELAVHEGDLPAYLRFLESAVDNFTTASDVRNACLQRTNVSNAYMQLGAYDRAVALMRGSLALAGPMQLDFVAAGKANLGISLAHLDELDEALRVETESLEQCVLQGNRRFEGVCRIYLAVIHTLRREKDKALEMARLAVGASEGIPPVRAYALAALSNILLMHNRPDEALELSTVALRTLLAMEGIEEGESLIRLTHALALRGARREEEGRAVIAEAKRRVLERADRIRDPQWRASFLENVTDNAKVIHIANQWLGEEG
jgi:serine/threonine protein kinase